MGPEYEIKLQTDEVPYSIFTPQSIPLPLRDKVREELNKMESNGIITKVEEPTPWCAGMVAMPKKSGEIRVCVDLKRRNESVLLEVYPPPRVDDILAQLAGAKCFSKLDANSGFWQIPLTEKSRLLTTFLTPFGWYCFSKLPFGISSGPELFQKRMSQIQSRLDCVVCLIDYSLVMGKNAKEHDERLLAVLQQVREARVTLNRVKCVSPVIS